MEHTHFYYFREKLQAHNSLNFLAKLSQSSLSHTSLPYNCSLSQLLLVCVFGVFCHYNLMGIYREEKRAKHPPRNDFVSHPPNIIMALITNLNFNNLAPPRFPLTLSPSSWLY
ncbi:hypothetical protein ACOSP7_019343 [Xanthoceras sorbifolium]